MSGPFFRKGISSFVILLALVITPLAGYSEVAGFSYATLDSRQEKSFRIAFWQDPDLSQLEFSRESFQEKLRRFGNEFEKAMKKPLVKAGFGEIKISIIDDYESLLEERTFGGFDLLHCDPAAYILSNSETYEPYTVLLEEVPDEPRASSHAVIWVTRESTHREPRDLLGSRVAIVDLNSLFGGAIQWARLWKAVDRRGSGPPFETVKTGAVSEDWF